MAESRESSVLFSLKGLQQLEAERVRTEEQRRREQAERAAAACEAAAAAAREAERARIVAAERAAAQERMAAVEARQRGEAARLVAVERARIEIEAAARVAVLERQQAHERTLREIAATGAGRRTRLVLLGSNAAWAALLVIAGGGYLTVLRPAEARQRAALAGLVQAETERAETGERLARDAEARARSLRDRVTELERAHADTRSVAPAVTGPSGGRSPAPGARPAATAEPAGCRSESGDPLDFSLCR